MTNDDVTMNNERRVAGRTELWIAAAGLFLTIIGAQPILQESAPFYGADS